MSDNEKAIADMRRVADILETAAMNHEMASNAYKSAAKALMPYVAAVPALYATLGAISIIEDAEAHTASEIRQMVEGLRKLCDDAEAGTLTDEDEYRPGGGEAH